MKIVRLTFVASMMGLILSGCSFLDSISGFHQHPDGSVTVDEHPAAGGIGGILGMIPGWGGLATGLLGIGLGAYNHFRIVQAGKKDDNWNGIPDDQERPADPVKPA